MIGKAPGVIIDVAELFLDRQQAAEMMTDEIFVGNTIAAMKLDPAPRDELRRFADDQPRRGYCRRPLVGISRDPRQCVVED